MTSSITSEEVHKFSAAWFHMLDVHAPLEACLTMLADANLRMRFPDGDIQDVAAFKKWYERVTSLFFDEQHTIRSIEATNGADDRMELELRVRWETGWWEPPAATSKHIDVDVSQMWVIRRCSHGKNAFGLEIVEYHVTDDFKYAPASAILLPTPPVDPKDLVALNERMVRMEQAGDDQAFDFFQAHLSDQLVFRRANGKIVGKSEPDGFLSSLKKNPFSSRRSEDISVTQLSDRALVTLMVVGTLANDSSVHRYCNIRFFTRSADNWILELWYNYEILDLDSGGASGV